METPMAPAILNRPLNRDFVSTASGSLPQSIPAGLLPANAPAQKAKAIR